MYINWETEIYLQKLESAVCNKYTGVLPRKYQLNGN